METHIKETRNSNFLAVLTITVTVICYCYYYYVASFVYFSRVRSVIKCYHVTYKVTFVVRGCNSVCVV